MINFLSLEYFLVAVEELNFTRTTEKLFISQQSLGNHISNLEKEFGVVLFNRTSSLTPTYAGQALKTRAREPLNPRDETYKEISDIKDFSTGQLTIGASHTKGRIILPEILPTYQAQFPGIELRLVEGNSSQLTSDLLHDNMDLMIDLLPFTMESVETVLTCDEEILMVVPDKLLKKVYPNYLKEIKQTLSFAADVTLLERYPSVLLKKSNRIRTISDEIFEDTQMSPGVVLETENIETALALCAKGMGTTFYPKMFMSPDQPSRSYRNAVLGSSHLNLYSLNYFRTYGVLSIGYHRGRYMSRATRKSVHIARECILYPVDRSAEQTDSGTPCAYIP